VGDKDRRSLRSPQGTPSPKSLQVLPTPTPHSLRALQLPPAPPPRYSPSPGTLQTWGQRSPTAAGELGRRALVQQVNARGRPAATPPTLPPGRDTPFPLSRLPGDVAAARRAPAPRGSGSGLTGSGELDSARATVTTRRRPGGCAPRRVRAARAGGALLAKSARGTGSVAHPPRVGVSQRETEGTSYRGAGGGGRGESATTPSRIAPPAPQRRRRQPLVAKSHPDTKTSCQPQIQVSPKPRGLGPRSQDSRLIDRQSD
jgi:hypothetical protein